LHALIETLECNATLHDPQHLGERLDALDRLELLQLTVTAIEPALRRRIVDVQERFGALNADLHARMRDAIRCGQRPPLLAQCLDDARLNDGGGDGYDWRDELIGGVLQLQPPAPSDTLQPANMVAYQPTPSRHIFSLLAQAQLTAKDVLVDLGSGLGHVPLLAAVCTDAGSIGIEREPAYVACAQAAADALQLSHAHFHCMDARATDFACGTLFYLYTPFAGAVLQSVLDALRREAQRRVLRIAAHGPCVSALAAQPWLETDLPARADRIMLFRPRH